MSRVALSSLLAALIVALGLAWHVAKENSWLGGPELGDPALQAGAEVVLVLGRVIAVEPGRAVLRKAPEDFVVLGDANWEVGEDWSVGGTWTGTAVVAEWAEVHRGRDAKRRLGVLGLLATGLLLGASVRGRPGHLAIRG